MQTESGKSILLVEDMAIIAMAEANTLKKNGFNVKVAYNGNEAIKIASENPNLDLILMDIDLGKGMDGTEAAQIILKTHDIPIVFLSNHTEKEIVEKTEKITSYGYVVKNSGETVLIASIKMAFKLFDAHRLRLESENKLLESDHKFHTLEKQIDDVIWTMDMNFRFTYISPSVEKMHGYTVDEMMKLNLQDYLTEESAQKAIDVLGEEISAYLKDKIEKNIVTIEIDQRKKDGTVFPTEIRARFLLDEHGLPSGIIGVSRDISKRYLAEKALRDSEKTLNLALEGAQIGFWDSNYETGRVYRSDIWASMLGYTIDEVDNTPEFWQKHIHPDDYERVMTEVNNHEAGKVDSFSVEHRMRTKSGKYKWILDWGKVFERTESGKPIRAMGLHIDIDDRIKTQQRLFETNRTLTLAIEGAQIGLWSQNFETGEVIRSEYWASMLGYEINEIENKLGFWKSLIHPDDYEMTIKAAEEHEQGKTEFYKVQHRLKCKDGSYKWILNWGKISERDLKNNPIKAAGIHLDINEQIKTGEALKASNERFRRIIEDINAILFTVDKKGHITLVNETGAITTGYKREELLGKLYLKLVHPEDRKRVNKVFTDQLRGNTPNRAVEFRYIKKDGSNGWLNFLTNQLYQEDKVVGMTGIAQDITIRKQMEIELREKETRYRSIVENLNQGFYKADRRGVFTYCNPGLLMITGYTEKELLGTISFRLVADEDQNRIIAIYKQAFKNKVKDFSTEFKVKTRTDRIFWVEQTTNFEYDERGIFKSATNILRDIDDRKKTERALKESEEKYRRFFEEDLSGVFLSTPDDGIKICNQAYVNMMEYDSIDALLQSNPVSHYPQSQQRIDFLNLLRKERKLTNHEGELVTRTGRNIKTLENILGIFDENDNLIEFWGYVNDITERKNAEQILKNAAMEKEALHRELLHRVKNSFNLIKSLMYLEREKLDNKEADKILENLEMRIGTLSKMYSLLNLSGISQQLDLGEYLNEITKSLAESYLEDPGAVELKSTFEKTITSPRTASSVGLIVNEILTNSLKYAFPDSRKGIISITLKNNNGNAEIEIFDNGIGVSEDFELENSKGMGLQLVNMLTQQLDGKIVVKQENGTRFKLIFPLEN